MVNSQSVGSDMASTPDDCGEITVTIKLPGRYGKQVRHAAGVAGVSNTKIARQILIAALENPSRESLLQEISTMAAEVGYLRREIEVLQRDSEGLRLATYLTTELLLVLIGGLSPEEAHKSIEMVLAEGDE